MVYQIKHVNGAFEYFDATNDSQAVQKTSQHLRQHCSARQQATHTGGTLVGEGQSFTVLRCKV